MNYRHIFHAGNFADVLKHALLLPLVRSMQRKERGFLFLDTHAGVGAYDLTSSRAERTAESVDGISRLWTQTDLPAPLADYVQIVKEFDQANGNISGGSIRYYPGSPMIAARLLRSQDRMALVELHADDFLSLKENMGQFNRVSIQKIDAYSALKAYLPPAEKRGLILIDPPYEDHNEASRLHEGLATALERFPSGVYAIWYPIKTYEDAETFRALISSLPLPPAFSVEMTVRDASTGSGLNGSGLMVINPPWQIETEFTKVMDTLVPILAQDEKARANLIWLRERV